MGNVERANNVLAMFPSLTLDNVHALSQRSTDSWPKTSLGVVLSARTVLMPAANPPSMLISCLRERSKVFFSAVVKHRMEFRIQPFQDCGRLSSPDTRIPDDDLKPFMEQRAKDDKFGILYCSLSWFSWSVGWSSPRQGGHKPITINRRHPHNNE